MREALFTWKNAIRAHIVLCIFIFLIQHRIVPKQYIKVVYEEEQRIRALPIHSIDTLRAELDALFDIRPLAPLALEYVDAQGDLVLVGSNADLSAYAALHDTVAVPLRVYQSSRGRRLKRKHQTLLQTTVRCDQPFRLLFLVTSQAASFARRQAVRQSWGADTAVSPRWRVVFNVGVTRDELAMQFLAHEAKHTHDVILSDVYEGFFNLTLKVQAGFEWAAKYCSVADYLVHVDDDVFVNPHQLLRVLDTLPSTGLYTGRDMGHQPVVRPDDPDKGVADKYGVTYEMFADDYYPPYVSGGFYTLSMDLVVKFAALFDAHAVDLQQPLGIDDAYVGVLAQMIGAKVTGLSAHYFQHWAQGCVVSADALSMHPAPPHCMRHLWAVHVSREHGELFHETSGRCLVVRDDVLVTAPCTMGDHLAAVQPWVHMYSGAVALSHGPDNAYQCVVFEEVSDRQAELHRSKQLKAGIAQLSEERARAPDVKSLSQKGVVSLSDRLKERRRERKTAMESTEQARAHRHPLERRYAAQVKLCGISHSSRFVHGVDGLLESASAKKKDLCLGLDFEGSVPPRPIVVNCTAVRDMYGSDTDALRADWGFEFRQRKPTPTHRSDGMPKPSLHVPVSDVTSFIFLLILCCVLPFVCCRRIERSYRWRRTASKSG